MNYYDIYSISNGVFLTFSKNLSKKLLYVSHSKETMDKKKHFYPNYNIPRCDFILLCVYVMFKYKPSSIYSMVTFLCDFRSFEKEFKVFLESIKQYKSILKKDVETLINLDGELNLQKALKHYYKKEISFITIYILNKLKPSEVTNINDTQTIETINSIFKFITFKQESFEFMESLLNKTILEI